MERYRLHRGNRTLGTRRGATIHRAVLQSQFRCSGSDGYLAWLDQVLQLRDTAQDDLQGIRYHLEAVDSPSTLYQRILELEGNGSRARLVAGYCWDWASKKDPSAWDITFPEENFFMRWNLYEDEGRYLEKAHSIDQVGCIHTVQGLEMDYVGVIIGPDLIVRNGHVVTQPSKRARTDRSLHGYKTARKEAPEECDARADAIIKNTYRTLMSRGLKGCLIHCTDAETQAYFRQKIEAAFSQSSDETEASAWQPPPVIHLDEQPSTETDGKPRTIPAEAVTPADNAVPFIELEVAAGEFREGFAEAERLEGTETWIALPELYRARPGLFVARIKGESMNRRIPNGALCLFEANPGGSRQGRVVLAYHRDIQDPDNHSALTVKRYSSEKITSADGQWQHSRITLACDTLSPGYEDIVLEEEQAQDLRILGEFKGTVA